MYSLIKPNAMQGLLKTLRRIVYLTVPSFLGRLAGDFTAQRPRPIRYTKYSTKLV